MVTLLLLVCISITSWLLHFELISLSRYLHLCVLSFYCGYAIQDAFTCHRTFQNAFFSMLIKLGSEHRVKSWYRTPGAERVKGHCLRTQQLQHAGVWSPKHLISSIILTTEPGLPIKFQLDNDTLTNYCYCFVCRFSTHNIACGGSHNIKYVIVFL